MKKICILGVLLAVLPTLVYAVQIADSQTGFSGVQGSNGWYYGGGLYGPANMPARTNFTLLDYYTNGNWHSTATNQGPYLNWDGGCPRWAGTPVGQWAVRRYVSTVSDLVTISGTMQHVQDGAGCDGTVGRIYLNNRPIVVFLMPSNNPSALQSYAVNLLLKVGDQLEMAIDPRGNAGWDATAFRMRVDTLPKRVIIADSWYDFSVVQRHADTSGKGHWQYGERADGTFLTNGWNYAASPYNAWTNSGGGVHGGMFGGPNYHSATNVTRRWTSGMRGQIYIDGGVRRCDESGTSDGIIAYILVNGVTNHVATIEGKYNLNGINDAYDVNSRLFSLTNSVNIGDTVDFMVNQRTTQEYDAFFTFVTISRDRPPGLMIWVN